MGLNWTPFRHPSVARVPSDEFLTTGYTEGYTCVTKFINTIRD